MPIAHGVEGIHERRVVPRPNNFNTLGVSLQHVIRKYHAEIHSNLVAGRIVCGRLASFFVEEHLQCFVPLPLAARHFSLFYIITTNNVVSTGRSVHILLFGGN